jgi:hypothetical protein
MAKRKTVEQPDIRPGDGPFLALLDQLEAAFNWEQEEIKKLNQREQTSNLLLEQLAASMSESRQKELARREEARKRRLEREKAAKAETGVGIAVLEPHQNPQEGPQDAPGTTKGMVAVGRRTPRKSS